MKASPLCIMSRSLAWAHATVCVSNWCKDRSTDKTCATVRCRSASISSQIGQERGAPPAAQAEPTPRAPSLHESPSSLFSANSDLSELLTRRKRENEQEVTGQGQGDVVEHPADSFREALGAYEATLTANHGHVSTSQAPITAQEEEKYYQHLLKQEQVLQPF